MNLILFNLINGLFTTSIYNNNMHRRINLLFSLGGASSTTLLFYLFSTNIKQQNAVLFSFTNSLFILPLFHTYANNIIQRTNCVICSRNPTC